MKEVKIILKEYLQNEDFSAQSAKDLIGKLVDYELKYKELEDLMYVLAAYRPEGGEGLHDKSSLLKELNFLINL